MKLINVKSSKTSCSSFTRNEEKLDSNKTFHNAIAPVIFCAQFFAVMPLQGLKPPSSVNLLKFNFLSPQMILAIIILFSNLTIMLLYVKFFQQFGLQVGNLVTMVFFTVSFTSLMSFIVLAWKWPRIIKKWSQYEIKFLKEPYHVKNNEKLLNRKIRITALVIAILGTAEHVMFQASTMYSFVDRIEKCNIQTDDIIKYYYLKDRNFVFNYIPYHILIGIMTHICSFISTVIWNFMDMFIILVSIGLNFRFTQMNNYIQRILDVNEWHKEFLYEKIRFDFIHLYDLLKFVDGELSFIILLSCFNNLYFICYQLLNVFKTLRYTINYAYFWYSTSYLLGRTIFLFMTAASINESSLVPNQLFRKIKNSCTEIDRFLHHINNEVIALSAMGFFHFTRKLLLSMMGTIVTFELVMIQFQWSTNQKDELPPLCLDN